MLASIYTVLAAGMKYWFLLLAALMVWLLISSSTKEYRERKAVLGEIGEYIGYLEILRGLPEAKGARIGITRDNTIGSGRNADIEIRHPAVQKSHAMIYLKGKKLILSPLTKGVTRINGRRADNAYAVRSGDVITLGAVEVKVYIRPELERAVC